MINQDQQHPQDDAGFDAFLRSELQQSQPYLMDNNFTASVMAKLPAQRKLGVWQERLIIVVPVFVIAMIVLSQFSLLAILINLWTLLVSMNLTSLLQMGLAVMLLVVTGACVWVIKQARLM